MSLVLELLLVACYAFLNFSSANAQKTTAGEVPDCLQVRCALISVSRNRSKEEVGRLHGPLSYGHCNQTAQTWQYKH
jgi:hypothetical protein